MRLIDADKADVEMISCYYGSNCYIEDVQEWLNEQPTIDAVEVVHGYWKERLVDDFRMVEVKCSECGWAGIENYDAYVDPSDFDYCPNCGAKMDGERRDE